MYKKFDLEAAKNGAPVISDVGHIGRVICHDKKGDHPVIVLFDYGREEGIAYYRADGTSNSYASIFMAPVKKKGWINIYPPGSLNASAYCSEAYISKVIADHYAKGDRITCIEIEWSE
jgi:hypothetical protein